MAASLAPVRCPRCDSGWVITGAGPIAGPVAVQDVFMLHYDRCPLRCDGGILVRAVDIGARAVVDGVENNDGR